MADLMTMLLVLGGFAAAYVFYFWVLIKVSEWDGSSETKRYIARLESHLGLTEDDDLWDSPETELRKAEFLRERYSDDLFSNRLATFVYYPWSAFYLIRAFALLIAYLAVAWVAFDEGAYNRRKNYIVSAYGGKAVKADDAMSLVEK